MDENQNTLQIHSNIKNSCLMQQLSDGLQRIAINQIDFRNGLDISESSDSMISSSNNDVKAKVSHLNEKFVTNLNMLFASGGDMEKQNSMEIFEDLPSTSKSQINTKAVERETWHESSQDTEVVNTKNDYCHSTLGCLSEHANEIQNKRYESYSNLINRYCYKCKLVSKNISDSECYNCQSLLQFQCKKCGNLYKKHIGVESHIKYECYRLPTFYCSTCSYTTYHKISFINHTHTKHSSSNEVEYFHQCSVCNKKFKEYNSMLRHERLCDKKPKLRCQYCPYKTKLHQLLTQHIQKTHPKPISTKRYKCPDCNKKYKDFKTLHLHMKFTCSVKKFFQCGYCHFKTYKKFSLAQHIQEIHRFLYE